MSQEVRVRIAPSPTGDPHVGTAYCALFNYVFAKKHQGKFILRIEDTDQSRAKSSSEQQILDNLAWLGLRWDEGPDCGGPHGPYRQSERKPIYREYVDQLIEKGAAYPCFCTAGRLDEVRKANREKGIHSGYDRHCLSLSQAEVEAQRAAGTPYVIRMKMPQDGVTSFEDKLRGKIEIPNTQLDDQVILKSDGFPTYHLANVVDDYLMKVTHVIRAEEWISSTPKHVRLYEAFGWPQPEWIHLPLLRNQDKSKISKRKNPVSIGFYRRAGVLPEAMVNFLGLMGWSMKDDQEIFSLDQMIDVFDFAHMHLGGPVFDPVKLAWVNQNYVQQMDDQAFVDHLREEVFSKEYLLQLKPLMLERIQRFDQFVDRADFFFNGSLDYTGIDLIPKNKEPKELKTMLAELCERLDDCYEWQTEKIEQIMAEHKEQIGWKPRDYFMTVRLVCTGRKDSPPLGPSLEVLGREIVRFRLRDVINSLKN